MSWATIKRQPLATVWTKVPECAVAMLARIGGWNSAVQLDTISGQRQTHKHRQKLSIGPHSSQWKQCRTRPSPRRLTQGHMHNFVKSHEATRAEEMMKNTEGKNTLDSGETGGWGGYSLFFVWPVFRRQRLQRGTNRAACQLHTRLNHLPSICTVVFTFRSVVSWSVKCL